MEKHTTGFMDVSIHQVRSSYSVAYLRGTAMNGY